MRSSRDASIIHPTAVVEAGAQLGRNCQIMAYAIVTRHCVLGDRVVVHPFAVIGGDPQHLEFDSTVVSGVQVGAGTVIREHATINRSIAPGKSTVVGKDCFLLTASHVAHDCVVGNHVVIANAVLLAGHVQVGDHAVFGGGAVVHQFCRIGDCVMVAGHGTVTQDVPHYTMVAERDDIIGLNSVGLRRCHFGQPATTELKSAYHDVFYTWGNIRQIAHARIKENAYHTPEVRRFLEFFEGGTRGFCRPRRCRNKRQTQAG